MSQKRLALLVGVSNYANAVPLENPVNDVDSMEIVLSKLGFDIITLKDINYKEFKNTLNEFGEKLNNYDVGLFYFAGHGIQVEGINYLVPMDANPKSEKQVEFDCLNANLILSLMEDANNSINLIFLDACRNNPFKRSWNRSPSMQGLSYMSAPYGTLIAYSTAPNKTASDGEGQNGLYTSILLDEIISPELTAIQVLQNVRLSVIKKTEGEQIPWESTSLVDDFVFNDNRYFSLSTFCKSILYSERDVVFNSLKLTVWDTHRVVKSGMSLDSIDTKAGVIEAYYKNNITYFDIFDEIGVEINKNGERDYHLFTTTNDYNKITLLSKELYKTLGMGLYNDERHSTFRETEKIKNLALGKANNSKDELITIWYFKHVTFSLKYLIKPQRRFMFSVMITPQKQVIKRNIYDALQNDYIAIIESSNRISIEEKNDGYIEEYYSPLVKPEFDYFDTVTIIVFSKGLSFHNSSNVILSNKDGILDAKTLSLIVSELTLIYGLDVDGNGYLTGEEYELIENNEFWTGRSWDINIQHQAYDTESAGEEMMYGIHLSYFPQEEGLELTIIGYKAIIDYIQREGHRASD